MLALSLSELVFGLLINRTLSDKTSNCANVAPVSGANLSSLVNSEWGEKQEPGCGLGPEKKYIKKHSGSALWNIKASLMPDLSPRHDGEIFPELFKVAFQKQYIS